MKITLAELGRLLGYSPQRIGDYVREGMPATRSRGKGVPRYVNVRQSIDWLTAREIARHVARDGGTSRAEADRQRMAALAIIARVKADESENRVIPRAEALKLIRHLLAIVAARLDTLPAIADRLAAVSDPATVRDIVFTHCRAIRSAITDDFEAKSAAELKGAPGALTDEPPDLDALIARAKCEH